MSRLVSAFSSVPFLLCVSGLSYVGMTFDAWGWPAIDGYPTIERFLDPTYLTTDFYTNTSRGYGVDTFQAYVFGGLQRWTGVPYAVSLAVLNLIRCATFPALVYFLFLGFAGDRRVALLGTLLGAVSNFALPHTLGWAWAWGDPSTAMFALSCVIGGWTWALQRRYALCLLVFSLAALLHPLTTLHGMLVLALIFLFDYDRAQRLAVLRTPSSLLCGLVFAAAFGSQFFLLKADRSEALPVAEYVRIIAYERHPGDFLPSRFAPSIVAAFGMCSIAVGLALARLGGLVARRRLVVAGIVMYFALALLGSVFVEVWPVRFFVQMIPFRTANIVAPLMLLVIASFAGELWVRGRYASLTVLVSGFVLASPYAIRFPLPHAVRTEIVPLASALLLLAVGLSWIERGDILHRLDDVLRRMVSPNIFWPCAACVLLAVSGREASFRRDAFVLPNLANQHSVYRWAKDHTSIGATFLIDQASSDGRFGTAINPQKMRLVGRRAVVASLDFPFLDRDMRPWSARWNRALHGRELDRVEHADAAELAAVRREFPFEYVIRRTPLDARSLSQFVQVFSPGFELPSVYVYRWSDVLATRLASPLRSRLLQ